MPVTLKDKSLLTPELRLEAEAPARAIVAGSKYAGSPYEGFIRYMERWQNEKRTEQVNGRTSEQWYSTLTSKPYMETAGRLAEANDDTARPILALRSWLNDTAETLTVEHDGATYLVPARHAKAVLVRLIKFSDEHVNYEQVFEADEAIRHSDKGVDASHPLANAQTSAIGRVLGNAGYGLLPGSSISPAETMAATPQDDASAEKPKAEPKAKAPKEKPDPLSIEELEALRTHLADMHEAPTMGDLSMVGGKVAADETLNPGQVAYLRAAFVARKAELKAPQDAEADEAAREADANAAA